MAATLHVCAAPNALCVLCPMKMKTPGSTVLKTLDQTVVPCRGRHRHRWNAAPDSDITRLQAASGGLYQVFFRNDPRLSACLTKTTGSVFFF